MGAFLKARKSRVRGSRIVPDRASPVEEFSFAEAVAKFAPSGSDRAVAVVLSAPRGGFLGTVRYPGKPVTNFALHNPVIQTDFEWVAKAKPDFVQSIVEVYEVLDIDRGKEVSET